MKVHLYLPSVGIPPMNKSMLLLLLLLLLFVVSSIIVSLSDTVNWYPTPSIRLTVTFNSLKPDDSIKLHSELCDWVIYAPDTVKLVTRTYN